MVALPDVAFANNGYTLVAVLVSLLIAAPPTEAQAVPLWPSNWVVEELKRKYPATPVGCSAVVPTGSNIAPVPVNNAIPVTVGAVKVSPAIVAAAPPRLTDVEPIVIELLVNAALPILVIVLVEPLIDLLVKVSVVARPTRVSVDVGRVSVPVLTMVPMTGDVRVLLVNVSVVARPTRVSVDVGSVNVPVLTMVAMTGAVSVLLVRVCVTPMPTRVVSASGIV